MMQAERHLERLFTVVEVIFHNKIALVVIFITTGAIHHAGIRERQMAAHAGEIIGESVRGAEGRYVIWPPSTVHLEP